jgi:hypothetical protein
MLVLAVSASVQAGSSWIPEDGYDWWSDCSDIPDPLEFLPIYLGSELPGFVDLGRTVQRGPVRWGVMQYTRDKDLGPTRISAGRWYGGMGADEWPAGSVYARRHIEHFRVMAWEVDGNRHRVDPSCIIVLPTEERTIGFYNVWVRFNEPGVHTLKIIGRQVGEFFFTYPFLELGTSDPLGLEGRRVFLTGESVGDVLDDEFIHTYELHVGKDEGTSSHQ